MPTTGHGSRISAIALDRFRFGGYGIARACWGRVERTI